MSDRNKKTIRLILSIIIFSILIMEISVLTQAVTLNEEIMEEVIDTKEIVDEIIEESESIEGEDEYYINKESNEDIKSNDSYTIICKDYDTDEEINRINIKADIGSKINYKLEHRYENMMLVSKREINDLLDKNNTVYEVYYKKEPKDSLIKNYIIRHEANINGKIVEIANPELGEAFIGTRITREPLDIKGYKANSLKKELYIENQGENELIFQYDLTSNLSNFSDLSNQVNTYEEVKPEAYITYRAVDGNGQPIVYKNEKVEFKFLTTSEETITSDIRLIGTKLEEMTEDEYVLAYESTERTHNIPAEGLTIDVELLKNPKKNEGKSTYIIEHIGKEYFINQKGEMDYQELPIQRIEVGIGKVGSRVKAFSRRDLKYSKFKNLQVIEIDRDTGEKSILIETQNDNGSAILTSGKTYKFVFNYDLKNEYMDKAEEIETINDNIKTKEEIITELVVKYIDKDEKEAIKKEEVYPNTVKGVEVRYPSEDIEEYQPLKENNEKYMEDFDTNELIHWYEYSGPERSAKYKIIVKDTNGDRITDYNMNGEKEFTGIHNRKEYIDAPEINDWTLVSKTPVIKTLHKDRLTEVEFIYEKLNLEENQVSYIEKHVERVKVGNHEYEIDIIDPRIGVDKEGTKITISSRDDLKGYKLLPNHMDPITKTLDKDSYNNEFKFVYEKTGETIVPPKPEPEDDKYAAYRIYYQDEDGRNIKPVEEFKRAIVGAEVGHEAKSIKGYVAIGDTVQKMIIHTDKEAGQNAKLNRIIFKYRRSTAKYKVNYRLEVTNEEISEPSIVDGFDTKLTYAEPQKQIEGYSLISQNPIEIVLDKNNMKEVTFYYTKDFYGLVPYTIRHVEKFKHEGKTIERDIIDPKVGYDLDRSKIIAKYIDFSNYDLKDKKRETMSVVLNKDRFNEIKFVYVKNDEEIDDEKEIEDHNKNKYSSYMVKHTNKNTERALAEDEIFERAVIDVTIEREALRFEEYYAENTPLSLRVKDAEEISENLMEFFYIRRPTTGGGGGGGGGVQLPGVDEEDEEDEEVIELDINSDHLSYIEGYPDNTVRPENNIKREEVAAVIYRILEPEYRESIRTREHNFSDIIPDKWSEEYIATLAQEGVEVLEGYTTGEFRPERPATRAEMVTMLARFNQLDIESSMEGKFPDTQGHWANNYINAAANEGWVEGYEGEKFRPDNKITRAEFVTMVNNTLGRHTKKENMLEDRKEFKDLESYRWYYEAMQEAINSHECSITPEGVETWTRLLDEKM